MDYFPLSPEEYRKAEVGADRNILAASLLSGDMDDSVLKALLERASGSKEYDRISLHSFLNMQHDDLAKNYFITAAERILQYYDNDVVKAFEAVKNTKLP